MHFEVQYRLRITKWKRSPRILIRTIDLWEERYLLVKQRGATARRLCTECEVLSEAAWSWSLAFICLASLPQSMDLPLFNTLPAYEERHVIANACSMLTVSLLLASLISCDSRGQAEIFTVFSNAMACTHLEASFLLSNQEPFSCLQFQICNWPTPIAPRALKPGESACALSPLLHTSIEAALFHKCFKHVEKKQGLTFYRSACRSRRSCFLFSEWKFAGCPQRTCCIHQR